MKRIVLHISALFLFLGSYIGYAQIAPVVEVNRDYQVKLTDARKPFMSAYLPDSLQSFNIDFDYSIFNRPYSDLYDFTPRQITALEKAEKVPLPHFSAELGAQFPFIPEIAAIFQHSSGPGFNVGAYAEYNGFHGNSGDMVGGITRTIRSHFDVGANVKFAWKTGEFTIKGAYNGNNVRDEKDLIPIGENTVGDTFTAHRVNTAKVDAILQSANPDKHSLFYRANISFRNTRKGLESYSMSRDSVYNENVLAVALRMGSNFEEHRMYLDLNTKNCWYGAGGPLGLVEFTPIYEYSKGAIDAKLGVKFSSIYGVSEGTKIYPYMDARFELMKSALWLRATAQGGSQIETLGDNADIAPWMCMNFRDSTGMKFSDTKIDAKISVETMLFHRLAMSFFGSYAIYNNKLQLYSEMADTPVLVPAYVDYARLTAGLETSFSTENMKLFGMFRYNVYTSMDESPLYLLPKYEAFVRAEYNIHDRLHISAYFDFKSDMKYRDAVVPSFKDLGAKVVFDFSTHFSAFVKAGNILGADNYRYAFIGDVPRNFGGGISVNF